MEAIETARLIALKEGLLVQSVGLIGMINHKANVADQILSSSRLEYLLELLHPLPLRWQNVQKTLGSS